MRLMPIITALIVCGVLYMLIFERDEVMAFAQATVESDEEEVAATGPAPVRVSVRTSEARMIESGVVLRGRTEVTREVTVSAETSGRVISEPIRRGSMVEADDLLCELDPGTRVVSLAEAEARLTEARGRVPAAEAGLAEAQARVREAEINVNAARQLSQGGFASETRLVSAEAGLEAALAGVQAATAQVSSAAAGIQSAEAAVAAAEREIDRLKIHAPFGGLLETDTAELGTLMQPGAPCATIIQLDPIMLVGFVPETEVDKVSVGAMAGGRLASGRELVGQVSFLSRAADETTRTFRVEIDVPNTDLSISDGQTAEILIASEGQSAHLLAGSSLTLDDAGQIGIRTVGDGNVTEFLPVSIVRDSLDGIWVAGLPDTVDVIVVGQEFVREGVVVEPVWQEAGQ